MHAMASSLAGHHMGMSRRTGFFFIDEGRLQGGDDQMLNVLQVASKVLGKNPPYFAGFSLCARVSDKHQGCLCLREALGGQSHREEWTWEWRRHFRKHLIWIHLR